MWTGGDLIVWGGGKRGDRITRSGAAYDPAENRWRKLPQAPIGLNLMSGMWTGQEILVFGSLLDNRNIAATRTAVGAAYNPATDRWRRIPPSALSPQATSAVWVRGRMVAWDYAVHWQELRPARDRWSEPRRMPFGSDECYPQSTAIRRFAFAFFCGRVALYDPAARRWRRVGGGPLDATVQARSGTSYRRWRFASLVPAGAAVFLAMEGITTHHGHGEVCYGCPGSPFSYWMYRPPH